MRAIRIHHGQHNSGFRVIRSNYGLRYYRVISGPRVSAEGMGPMPRASRWMQHTARTSERSEGSQGFGAFEVSSYAVVALFYPYVIVLSCCIVLDYSSTLVL